MGYRWGEHVGELELRLDAPDEHGVFAAGTAALGELLGGDEPRDAGEWFDVAAEGADPAGRLAAWLEELVFLAEHDGVVPVAVAGLRVDASSVRGRVGGYRADPPNLVLAVTYHGWAFARAAAGGYEATVVLDV